MPALSHDPAHIAAGKQRKARPRPAKRVRRDLWQQPLARLGTFLIHALDALGEKPVADVAPVQPAAGPRREERLPRAWLANGQVRAQLLERERGELDVASPCL